MGTLQIDPAVLLKYRTLGEPVGHGAFGTVWKAKQCDGEASQGSKPSGRTWALKKCHDPFRSPHDAQSMFREVMILRSLRHDNIVRLREVLRDSADKDLYLVLEYVDTTVLKIIESGQLQNKTRSCIMYQLLNAVQFLHSAELVHRDVKPANLLIDSACRLRLADFGEARSIAGGLPAADDRMGASAGAGALPVVEDLAGGMTECGFTLWYNAPEVIVGSASYGKAVDVWACGCVCGELLGKHRRPLFMGSSQVDQLSKYVNLIGLPGGDADIDSLDSRHAHDMMRNVPRQVENKVEQSGLFVDCPDGMAMLSRLLVFCPARRAEARDLLTHRWVMEYHDSAREKPRKEPVLVEFEGQARLRADDYRDALYTRLNLSAVSRSTIASSGSPAPLLSGSQPAIAIPGAQQEHQRQRSQQEHARQQAVGSPPRSDPVREALLDSAQPAPAKKPCCAVQ